MRGFRIAYRLGYWCLIRKGKVLARFDTEREARAAARGLEA